MGGPVKFVINQAVEAIVGYVTGDAITAIFENAATYLDWRKDRERYINDRVIYDGNGLTKEQITAEVTTKGEAVGFATNIFIGLGSRMVKVVKPDIPHIFGTSERGDWSLGEFKSNVKWANQMEKRGWTPEQISETLSHGKTSEARNFVYPLC